MIRGTMTGNALVDDGTSGYVIALDPAASPSERWAAEELSDHLRLMSGADLAVRPDAAPPAQAIVLGFGSAAERLGIRDDGSLGEEGYRIRTVGAGLVIAGSRLRGTLYGVYAFLELLGVRWWTPGETTIPSRRTIPLPELDVRDVPRLAYRDMMYNEAFTEAGKLWMARNRLNGMSWASGPEHEKLGGRYEYAGKHLLHGCSDLLRSSGVPLTDDMWSQVDGRRLPDSQPCFTNPAVVAAVASSAIRELTRRPQARFVAVGHDELWFGHCRCAACAKVAQAEGPSGLMVQFANQVAELVEKRLPGGAIATGAYHWSCQPPLTIRPRHNVIIAYDPLSCDYAHPLSSGHEDALDTGGDDAHGDHHAYRIGEHARIRREIAGWGRIAKRLILYDYTACTEHPCMPYPNLHVLAANVRHYAEHGFTGIFTLGSLVNRGSEFHGLRMWMLAKALWNPDADGRELLAEFVRGYYGAAAPAIQAYIDIMHRLPESDTDCYLPFWGNFLNSRFVRPEIIAEAEQALREADALALGDPVLAGRVRHAHMPVWYMLAKKGPDSATWKLTEARVGRIDIRRLAQDFALVASERGRPDKPDGELGPPFTEWLHDYARLVAESGAGRVVPPELGSGGGAGVRIIQACQMDRPASRWRRTEGASDGWCLVLEAALPAVPRGTASAEPLRGLMPGEDYIPGRTYRIFARIKGEGRRGDGVACTCTVHGRHADASGAEHSLSAWQMTMGLTVDEARRQRPVRRDVLAEELPEGRFQVIEVAELADPTLFTCNMPVGASAMARISLDCFWLVEVAGHDDASGTVHAPQTSSP